MRTAPTACEHPASVVTCPGDCGIPGFHLHWQCGSGCGDRVETRADAGGAVQSALPTEPAQQVLPLPATPAAMAAVAPRTPSCGASPAHAFCEPDFCHVAYESRPLLSRCA